MSAVKEIIYIERKDRESGGSLMRRFSRRVQQAGILPRARSLRFFVRAPSEAQKKKSALHRIGKRKTMERLYKLGKITKTTKTTRRSR